eukprot:NODE_87_length_21893_cov_0.496559.p6 type:complete len:363 gc:universal NODE_87_length_21893_cov_0.496559:6844-5756(-)
MDKIYFCAFYKDIYHVRHANTTKKYNLNDFKPILSNENLKIFFKVPNDILQIGKNLISLKMATKSVTIQSLFKECKLLPWEWYDWFLEHEEFAFSSKDVVVYEQVWTHKAFTAQQIQEFITKTKDYPVDENRLHKHRPFDKQQIVKECQHKHYKWMAIAYCGKWLKANSSKKYDYKLKPQVMQSVAFICQHKRDFTKYLVEQLNILHQNYLLNQPKQAIDRVESKLKDRLQRIAKQAQKWVKLLEKSCNNNCKIVLREANKNMMELYALFNQNMEIVECSEPHETMSNLMRHLNEIQLDLSKELHIAKILTKLEKRFLQLRKVSKDVLKPAPKIKDEIEDQSSSMEVDALNDDPFQQEAIVA